MTDATLLQRMRKQHDAETLERWSKLLAAVELHRASPWRVTQSVSMYDSYTVEVVTRVEATDVDSGEPTQISRLEMYPADAPADHAIAFLANQIRDVLIHEIDECLLVAGRKWRNPHMHVGARCPDHKSCRVAMVDWGEKLYRCASSVEERQHP